MIDRLFIVRGLQIAYHILRSKPSARRSLNYCARNMGPFSAIDRRMSKTNYQDRGREVSPKWSSPAPAADRPPRPGERGIQGLVCQLSTGGFSGWKGGIANRKYAASALTNGSYRPAQLPNRRRHRRPVAHLHPCPTERLPQPGEVCLRQPIRLAAAAAAFGTPAPGPPPRAAPSRRSAGPGSRPAPPRRRSAAPTCRGWP